MKSRALVIVLASVLALALVTIGVFGARQGQASETPPIAQYPNVVPTATPPAKPSGPVTRGAVFGDQFSTASLDNYEVVDLSGAPIGETAIWAVRDGALFQDRTAPLDTPDTRETLAIIRESAGTDYTVSANIYDENNATFGLIVRRQGDSFYRFSVISSQYEATPKLRLEKVIGGNVTPLATLDGPGYNHHEWINASLSVRGSTLEARVNGQVVLTATDGELSAGQAGLYTRAMGDIRFDDVVVAGA